MPNNNDTKRKREEKNQADPASPPFKMPPKKTKNGDQAEGAISLDDIANLIRSTNNSIDVNHDDISTKIESMTKNFHERIDKVDYNCKVALSRLDSSEDAIERITKANDLRIIGVPMSQHEDLKSIFKRIAKVINYSIDCPLYIPSLSRLGKPTNTNDGPSCPTIIAQFMAPHIKRQFFNAYLKKLTLSTADLGYHPPSKRVIINENLTKLNKAIFDDALLLRKQKKLSQVFTVNGLVYVRNDKSAKPTLVRSGHELHSAVVQAAAHEHHTPHVENEALVREPIVSESMDTDMTPTPTAPIVSEVPAPDNLIEV